MPEEPSGSTVPRRQLGRYLEELRENAGLTRKQAADALERSAPTLWRIETGRTPVRGVEVSLMCDLYGASAEMKAALVGLAGETKAKGWWQAYGDAVPHWFDLYVGLEAAATRISWYEAEIVPGLFQTEEYARTIIRTKIHNEDDAEIERRVQLRMARQAILRRPINPLELRIVISETVLLRPVGGTSVMVPQLNRLLEASKMPNVSLRVIPFSAGFHAGMLTGSFEILGFPLNGGGTERDPDTVYSDLFTGAIYLDKQAEIASYNKVFGEIREASLDEEASRDRIRRATEELRDG